MGSKLYALIHMQLVITSLQSELGLSFLHKLNLSYRSFYLLDTMGKILEKIIYKRLSTCAEVGGALSDLQYGFRKGRSVIETIRWVVTIAKNVIEGDRWRSRNTA